MKTSPLFCGGALLFVVAMCGCSQQPAKLAHQIAGTERIVATNSGTGVGFSIAGDEAREFARAIASAKRDRNKYLAVFDWNVQFYSGTNLLAVIRFQDRIFKIESLQYRDDTGVLKAFYEGPLREATAKRLSQ